MLSYLFWAHTAPDQIFAHPVSQPLIRLLNLTEPDQLLFPLTAAFVLGALFAGMMRLFLLGHKQDLLQLA